DVVVGFWRKIAYLTTRTKRADGRWMGGQEVRKWNANNHQSCRKCDSSREFRPCIIDLDQPSCRPCLQGKSACDRKTQFLFESTRHDFFPTMEAFLKVFNSKPPEMCRSFQRSAN
ncbi:hypothetical protein R3P38DRAFT_2359220, partial [Favolaschia claudopus]